MSHRRSQPEGYEARLMEYMGRELHPETAQHIGDMVMHSELLSAEMAMAVIIQMQLDHVRKDAELDAQQMADIQLERTNVVQADFRNRVVDL